MTHTGPIGRLARLVLAAAYGATLVSIVGPEGSARFRNPHILSEPSAWLLHALMFLSFVLLAGAVGTGFHGPAARRLWQAGAVVVAVLLVVVAELFTIALGGSRWGFPLADLVWWFDVSLLAEGVVATVLSIGIGLPGCEIGVWPWLISHIRGKLRSPKKVSPASSDCTCSTRGNRAGRRPRRRKTNLGNTLWHIARCWGREDARS